MRVQVIVRCGGRHKPVQEFILAAPRIIIRHTQRQGNLHQAVRRVIVFFHKEVPLFQHGQAGLINHAVPDPVHREQRQFRGCGKGNLNADGVLRNPHSPWCMAVHRNNAQFLFRCVHPLGNRPGHIPEVPSRPHGLRFAACIAADQFIPKFQSLDTVYRKAQRGPLQPEIRQLPQFLQRPVPFFRGDGLFGLRDHLRHLSVGKAADKTSAAAFQHKGVMFFRRGGPGRQEQEQYHEEGCGQAAAVYRPFHGAPPPFCSSPGSFFLLYHNVPKTHRRIGGHRTSRAVKYAWQKMPENFFVFSVTKSGFVRLTDD